MKTYFSKTNIYRILLLPLFLVGVACHKTLKFMLAPFLKIHPRVACFASRISFAFRELLKPPTSYSRSDEYLLPEWLIREWKEIHFIEPQVFPDSWLTEHIPFYKIRHSRVGENYLDLIKLVGTNVSHVFIIPWLTTGGADMATINYIRGLVEFLSIRNVTVIATESSESPWAGRLPKGVQFIEFGNRYADLKDDEKEKLLVRVLLQTSPKVIHNINSSLCYDIFIKYGEALCTASKLFATVFCVDINPDGRHVGYGVQHLPSCFECLTGVSSDNQAFLDRLEMVFGFEKNKLFLHHHPVPDFSLSKIASAHKENEVFNILWAGRLDRQKRPDLLLKIADSCKNLPFRFHVYGVSVIGKETVGIMDELSKRTNIEYYGRFDGLQSLPVENFDLFLYTSQWDGLPTIILDAMNLHLPVIASNVGGISEIIVHEKTGYLIGSYDDTEAYKECLISAHNDPKTCRDIADNAYALVKQRHSWDNFISDLKNFTGYFSKEHYVQTEVHKQFDA